MCVLVLFWGFWFFWGFFGGGVVVVFIYYCQTCNREEIISHVYSPVHKLSSWLGLIQISRASSYHQHHTLLLCISYKISYFQLCKAATLKHISTTFVF